MMTTIGNGFLFICIIALVMDGIGWFLNKLLGLETNFESNFRLGFVFVVLLAFTIGLLYFLGSIFEHLIK